MPASALTFLRIWAEGEVCLSCSRPIYGSGVRIRYGRRPEVTLTTHAHLVCRVEVRRLLV